MKRNAHCFNCGEDLGVIDFWPGDFPTCGSIDCNRAERDAIREEQADREERARDDDFARY